MRHEPRQRSCTNSFRIATGWELFESERTDIHQSWSAQFIYNSCRCERVEICIDHARLNHHIKVILNEEFCS